MAAVISTADCAWVLFFLYRRRAFFFVLRYIRSINPQGVLYARDGKITIKGKWKKGEKTLFF